MNYIPEIKDSVNALKWAMEKGNSTANSNGFPRGLGLDLLRSFVKANQGSLRLCTGNVLYTYSDSKGEQFHLLDNGFYGTLFEIDIISDNERYYRLG